MTDTETLTTTEWDGEGPPPIYDTSHLLRRIQALDPERQGRLGELWQANGLGALDGLLTAEVYRAAEQLVHTVEPTAPADQYEQMDLAQRLVALPEHIASKAWEAIDVYAGTRAVSQHDLISVGRLNELRRIVTEAVAYAATLSEATANGVVPTVADLPPVDDMAPIVESDEYPGTKADAKTITAWVGADRNRAARAYAHEQERSTVRKGLTAKLVEVLGPEGLAKVTEAMAAAAPPPLDLGAPSSETPPVSPPTAGSEGVGGADSGFPSAVETAPPAPDLEAMADAFHRIAKGFDDLGLAIVGERGA